MAPSDLKKGLAWGEGVLRTRGAGRGREGIEDAAQRHGDNTRRPTHCQYVSKFPSRICSTPLPGFAVDSVHTACGKRV
jgi:hypothetical protein